VPSIKKNSFTYFCNFSRKFYFFLKATSWKYSDREHTMAKQQLQS
jgi:hypothetical protein